MIRKIKKPMTTTCVRLKATTLQKVEDLAIKEERSVSEVMRLIIEKYFKNAELVDSEL